MACQLNSHLQSSDLLLTLQSGFYPGCSTETAVLRVLSHLQEAVYRRDIAALVLQDLSAGSDTVDYSNLCQQLQLSGLDGPVVALLHSYLHRAKGKNGK